MAIPAPGHAEFDIPRTAGRVIPGNGPAAGGALSDARWLARLADRELIELEKRSQLAAGAWTSGRYERFVRRSGQWFVRKGKEIIQDHWDVGLFDVAFGSIKAFGIYPALYFAGLTWTIPIMEYAPLNTQLWTAGYLFARRSILSRIGQRRYGHSLKRMDAFRDRSLRVQPRDARHIHRFEFDGIEWTVRVRGSRARVWLERLRGKPVVPNAVLQRDLRRIIPDEPFLFLANPLRSNAYYYEEVLIKKVLATPPARAELLARLRPEQPLADPRSRQLLETVGETLIPSYSRVVEQGDSLVQALRSHLDSGFSMTSMALRWINWSFQRKLYREMADLDRLHYRLIADLLDGRALDRSPQLARIRRCRAGIQTWLEHAAQFGDRARQLRSKGEAHELIERGIAEAQALGLSVRLARTARWLSPSGRTAR